MSAWEAQEEMGNESDTSYVYLDPISGNCYPLLPFLMEEWVRGMVSALSCHFHYAYTNTSIMHAKYNGLATVDTPPATTAFDPQNCLTSISPMHC
jgi:hypothetical protein